LSDENETFFLGNYFSKITNMKRNWLGVLLAIKLSLVEGKDLRIKCSCTEEAVLSIANLIAIVGPDVTTHEIRKRVKCKRCGAIGDNTYRVI
jgi:hypothetical protein